MDPVKHKQKTVEYVFPLEVQIACCMLFREQIAEELCGISAKHFTVHFHIARVVLEGQDRHLCRYLQF